LSDDVIAEAKAHGELRGHLAVFSGASHAPGFVFTPSKDDDGMEDLNIRDMRTVVKEALCGIRVGIRHGGGTTSKHVRGLGIPCSESGYAVGQQRGQGAIEYAAGDVVVLKEGEIAGEALKEYLNEVYEYC
jgi:hypothetical protein